MSARQLFWLIRGFSGQMASICLETENFFDFYTIIIWTQI